MTGVALTKQPLKGLYTIYFLMGSLVKLPFVLLYYIPPAGRPHKSYTYRISVWVTILQWAHHFFSRIEFVDPRSLEPGKEGDRFVVIQPGPTDGGKSAYKGVTLQNPLIKPQKVGAVWYPAAPSAANLLDKKVIIHFHGEAYNLYGAREDPYRPSFRLLADKTNTFVLAPEYRLASGKNASFPAQLQDGITVYRYVLEELKVPASSIILAGDSAGGHLVITMLKYLISDVETGLSMPVAAILWSPWVDMANCLEASNPKADTIPDSLIKWGARSICGDLSPEDPYLSPIREAFKVPIPIWVSLGTVERHANRIIPWVELMKNAGNKLNLFATKDYPHDLIGSWKLMGAQKQYEEALDDAILFLTLA